MITLAKVKKTFGVHEVLVDVTLAAVRGEILCLSGSSGCGKSTILKIAAGIVKPDTGTVRRESDRIGFAFQNDVLLPWKSAMENMVYILRGYYTTGESEERAKYWLEEFNLTASMNRKPAEMSGGMRKRLSIAMSFSIDPQILFLDEPFAFLDRNNISVIRQRILASVRSNGMTVILATHKLENMDKEGLQSCHLISRW